MSCCGSQGVSTFSHCGKKHFGNCLDNTSGCFGCGKNGHKVRDCPTIAARGREAKKVPPDTPNVGAPKRNHLYVLQSKENLDKYDGNLYFSLFIGDGFLLSGGVW